MVRDLIFVGFALVLFGIWGLPNLKMVLAHLLSRKVKCKFESDAEEVDPDEYPEQTRKLLGELEELGFQLLGVRSERRPFVYVRGLDYAHPEGQTFASLRAGMNGLESGRASYYFYTPYEDGAVMITSSAPIPPFETVNFFHGGFPDRTPSELYALHRKKADKMTRKGHQPYHEYDRDARIRATHAYYDNPGSRQMSHAAFMKCLGNFATSVGLVVLSLLVIIWRRLL
jgi:hypothetical protein